MAESAALQEFNMPNTVKFVNELATTTGCVSKFTRKLSAGIAKKAKFRDRMDYRELLRTIQWT